jgi:NAD+ kinase
VVEEDGAPRPRKRRNKATNGTEQRTSTNVPEAVEELVEEDDDEEEEEEEDKFDIDDSSPEAAAAAAAASAAASGQTAKEEALGREKAQELIADDRLHKLAASALKKERSRSAKSRSRSRTRAAGGRPGSPHVEFDLRRKSIDSVSSGVIEDQDGARDHINAPRSASGKSRIPKDRDLDADSVKTPTVANLVYGRGRGHSRNRSAEQNGHRAFAVWGHDESDSNDASDSET